MTGMKKDAAYGNKVTLGEKAAAERVSGQTKAGKEKNESGKKSGGLARLLAFVLRVLTAPPFAVLCSFSLIYGFTDRFGSLSHYLLLVAFIGFLPLLAYPLSFFVPALRKKGRKGQRTLALVLSLLGYLLGALTVFLSPAVSTGFEKVLAATYLFSGALIALTSAVGFKSSGHAAGVSGPAFLLTWTLGWPGALSFLLLGGVFWSSLHLKRHTLPQLIVGTLIPIAGVILFRFLFT